MALTLTLQTPFPTVAHNPDYDPNCRLTLPLTLTLTLPLTITLPITLPKTLITILIAGAGQGSLSGGLKQPGTYKGKVHCHTINPCMHPNPRPPPTEPGQDKGCYDTSHVISQQSINTRNQA